MVFQSFETNFSLSDDPVWLQQNNQFYRSNISTQDLVKIKQEAGIIENKIVVPSTYERISNCRLKVPPSKLSLVIFGSEESQSLSIATSIFGLQPDQLIINDTKINILSQEGLSPFPIQDEQVINSIIVQPQLPVPSNLEIVYIPVSALKHDDEVQLTFKYADIIFLAFSGPVPILE